MKPVAAKLKAYIDSITEINDKNPKFKIGSNVRILSYKNAFAKGYTINWSEDFVIKSNAPWTYVINDFNGE